ncbi:hypothetical protein ACNFBR_10620 [Pseudomonas sp. NY11955]|uniref:hypothetical protein n=1 Tax=Pseudomonas sp. NY11955 TaxID=3400363 RepID=UPI003A868CFA
MEAKRYYGAQVRGYWNSIQAGAPKALQENRGNNMAEQQEQGEQDLTRGDTPLSPEAMIEEKRKADELLERRLSRLEEAAGLSKLT